FSLKIHATRIDSRPRWRYSQAQIANLDTGFGRLFHPAVPSHSPELQPGPAPHSVFLSFTRLPSACALRCRPAPRPVNPSWRPSNPLKIALEITPNLDPLFWTRDENLRLIEDSLGVHIDLRSDAVHVE